LVPILYDIGMENVVEIKNVTKSYQLGSTEVHALRGLSLKIRQGEFAALIGSSGSGKTTLLNLVGCLDNPDGGEILIEGTSVAKLSENQKSDLRNKKIGFIFQSFNLIPVLNVFENVEIPLTIRPEMSEAQRHEQVMAALKDVGLEAFAQQRPDQLSGGQRQRVAIARALVTQPSLILADEPTANLDSKTAHHIIDLMFELNQRKKVTFFFCTHDEKLMGRVQRIVKIKDGVIES
jgi:putative ABC transport system ATP-binding protein